MPAFAAPAAAPAAGAGPACLAGPRCALTFASSFAGKRLPCKGPAHRGPPRPATAPGNPAVRTFVATSTSTVPASSPKPRAPRPLKKAKPRVLIVGGSGRVGSAVARNLQRLYFGDVEIYITGRMRRKMDRVGTALDATGTFELDYRDHDALKRAIQEVGPDILIHTAGPFQQLRSNDVLDMAMKSGVPYVDVCDDLHLARGVKQQYTSQAILDGIPVVISAGAFPGISNLMAAHMIEAGGGASSVDFSYFCAGSGGAGDAVMCATFLLLAEPVVTFENGVSILSQPYSGRKVVDFGDKIGRRSTFLYELPETTQIQGSYKVPNVSARFGTSPELWNGATRMVADYAPRDWLRDRERVLQFVRLINPLIRLVDPFVGRRIGMRVDVKGADGMQRRALYSHVDTVEAAGLGCAAFAAMVLAGRVTPGVHFPEQAVRNAVDRQELFDFTKVPGAAGYSFWS